MKKWTDEQMRREWEKIERMPDSPPEEGWERKIGCENGCDFDSVDMEILCRKGGYIRRCPGCGGEIYFEDFYGRGKEER